jgi:hypothetical protein
MAALDDIVAATVGGEALTLGEVLRRARHTGQLGFLRSAIEERLIARAVKERKLTALPEEVLRARALFMSDHSLDGDAALLSWLAARGMTEAGFREELGAIIRFGKLKEGIASDRVESYFEQHRKDFDVAELDHTVRKEIHARLFRAWLDEEWTRAGVDVVLDRLLG